jgi:integrase/recombinase XerD
MSMATAQTISSHTKRVAGITHGKGLHTLRHGFATPLLAAGVALRTMQLLLGHRSIDTTTRYLPSTRQPLAQVHSPCDLLGGPDDLPNAVVE